MKSIVMPKNGQMNDQVNDQLAQEVKETVVSGTEVKQLKKLTSADMWNLQRRSRSASSMMRRWNLN